jgi:peptide/nickel transport system substrate-binding protein
VLAIIAALVGVPSLLPAATTTALPSAGIDLPVARPYREGVVGHPVSVSPLTARTQADRDLVALVFSGLVRNGPSGTIVPDLAERWSVDESGAVWTFDLRRDAKWHDGQTVTSEDVVFTIRTLQDAAYHGPAAGSWNEVSVTTDGPSRVVFTLATPLGGFLQAATQPIAPAHLLADVPIASLAHDPFGLHPVGSGPFAVARLDDAGAQLVPPGQAPQASSPPEEPTVPPTDSLASVPPPERPPRPIPYLAGMDFTFYDTADQLAAAYRAGDLDAASGMSPALATDLATTAGSRLLRYPGSTLTAVLFNLRPGHPAFADPAVRAALLQAIDRPAIVSDAFGSAAVVAPGPIPPTSPLFDPGAAPTIAFDATAAKAALKKAGWTQAADGWHLPSAKTPIAIELLSPDEESNPAAFASAVAVAGDWTGIGLNVTHVPLPPAAFVGDRIAKGDFAVAVADVTIGLDPDVYPLLASSQTVSDGSNVIGIQDPALDRLLVAARGPGSMDAREAAYAALQQQLAKGRYLLPLAFADESVVVRDTVEGPTIRQVADPSDRFWDVLTWRLAAGG